MQRLIIGFDRDDEDHWRARLECGHAQHVRHQPPLTSRPWVLSDAGRQAKIGVALECRRCDDEARENDDG